MPSENEYTNPWASVEVLSYQGTSDVIDAICEGFFVGYAQGGASVLSLVGIIYAQDDRKSLYFPNLQNSLITTVDPPVVTLVSPAPGTALRAGDTVVFDVTSATPFHLEAFVVRLVATGEREAAYDRTAPAGAWDPRYAGSRVEQLADTHYRLHLRRVAWPGGGIGILPRVSNAGGPAS